MPSFLSASVNFVLFGPPGSGKGTQAVQLRDRYHLLHLSTGDVFRRELQQDSPLGRQVRSFLDQGQLVPDEVTFHVLQAEIERHEGANVNGLLFDGYPRTLTQAELLDGYLKQHQSRIHAVLSLQVSEAEVIRRILLRGATSGRSDDSDEQVVRNRLRVYEAQTLPLAEFYQRQGKLYTVPGEGTVEEIFQRLCHIVDRFV